MKPWTLLLGALLICTPLSQPNAEHAKKGSERKPTSRVTAMVRYELYQDQETVNKLCHAKPDTVIAGCWWKHGAIHFLVAIQPKDWCDWARLSTIGHETMHLMGWGHPENYIRTIPPGNGQSTTCKVL
jgi:hypothetical protein